MSAVKLHIYARGDRVVFELQQGDNPMARVTLEPADAMRVGGMTLSVANVANTQSTAGGDEPDTLTLDSLPSDYTGMVKSS